MIDPFQSSKLRLLNAKGHIENLRKKIREFFNTKPHSHVIEFDSDGINQLHKIKFNKRLPLEFATIAADAVDNLRSALDQAWHTVGIISKAIKFSEEAYFPIADNVQKFNRKIEKGCKKFPKDIVTLVRSFNPYKGGNDLLWALNRICAANKHRMLAPIGVAVGGMKLEHMNISGSASIPFPRWDRSKNEITYAVFGPNTKWKYNINISFDIAFDEVELVAGQPVVAVLQQLLRIVDRIVLGLEANTRKLGYI